MSKHIRALLWQHKLNTKLKEIMHRLPITALEKGLFGSLIFFFDVTLHIRDYVVFNNNLSCKNKSSEGAVYIMLFNDSKFIKKLLNLFTKMFELSKRSENKINILTYLTYCYCQSLYLKQYHRQGLPIQN